jgi:hypothetical protein
LIVVPHSNECWAQQSAAIAHLVMAHIAWNSQGSEGTLYLFSSGTN